MKKMLAFFLALVLTFSLCACAGTSQNSSGNPGQTSGQVSQNQPGESGETAETPASIMALQFTLDPGFTLYIGEDKSILSVDTESEEAQALLAQLEVVGKPYAEAITAILDAVHTQGYLEDGSQVPVIADIAEPIDVGFAFIALPISRFAIERGFTVIPAIRLKETEEYAPSYVIDDRKFKLSVNPQYGRDNTQIGSIITYRGPEITDQDSPTSYSKKEIQSFIGGDTAVVYYRNDSYLRTMHINADGYLADIIYYSDGTRASDYSCFSNGEFLYYVNAEDGTGLESETYIYGEYYHDICNTDGSAYSYSILLDGRRLESEFGPNGIPIYSVNYAPNGDSSRTTYHNNGMIKSQEDTFDGITICDTYDENGNLIGALRKEADGSGLETEFNGSGAIIGRHEFFANGDYVRDVYYENGQLKTSESMYSGVYTKNEYDEYGNLISTTNDKAE